MELINQVCSLNLAQRLKELNVTQESLFCWCGEGEHIKVMLNNIYDAECNPNFKICSAFTVAELGEMLPALHDSCKRYDNDWHVRVFEKNNDKLHNSFDKAEADARAKMLIYLLENGLLKHDNLHPPQ